MTNRILLAVLVMGLNPQAAKATEYFVATTGNNSAAGTFDAPWQTLQYAATHIAAGDRVTVRPGQYAGFHLTKTGTAAQPIEFFAEPGVLINAPNPIRPEHGINLENVSYVTVDGFAVTGMERAGVRSVGSNGTSFASHVTIRNVHSYNNKYWGILTGFVEDLLIENNETSGSLVEHGIYVSNSADRPIIRNNVSWGNRANGIHMNGDESLGGDGIISNALVSGNIIYDNGLGGGSGINMDGVQFSRIENNLIYNNHASGISLYSIDGGGGSIENEVVNNTVHQASNGRWALNIQHGSTGNTVLNNILVSQHNFRGAIDISPNSLPGLESDHNVVISRFTTNDSASIMSLAQWQSATGQDLNSVVATPATLFVNWNGGNYYLSNTSPAINNGTELDDLMEDLAGKPRPSGNAFDIGAYEWGPPPLLGDYNNDGTVRAADYTLWRDTLGSSAIPFSQADGDGDGGIDAGDFAPWRGNFGDVGGSASGVAVPEPGAMVLLCLGILIAGLTKSFHVSRRLLNQP